MGGDEWELVISQYLSEAQKHKIKTNGLFSTKLPTPSLPKLLNINISGLNVTIVAADTRMDHAR